ncbi:MAG: phosphoribosyl-ATP diphosphatase [Micavibrio sp.]|nr:phosphoribosyl-ATP diphosphatase [Micavibrio sp.]
MTNVNEELLIRLTKQIRKKAIGDPKKSYTAKMFKKGRSKMAQKVGEEATELVIEAIRNDKSKAVSESADLMFHLLVLWEDMGIEVTDILKELARREGISGLEEKASRPE